MKRNLIRAAAASTRECCGVLFHIVSVQRHPFLAQLVVAANGCPHAPCVVRRYSARWHWTHHDVSMKSVSMADAGAYIRCSYPMPTAAHEPSVRGTGIAIGAKSTNNALHKTKSESGVRKPGFRTPLFFLFSSSNMKIIRDQCFPHLDIVCNICRRDIRHTTPMCIARYKCTRCLDMDMCHECYTTRLCGIHTGDYRQHEEHTQEDFIVVFHSGQEHVARILRQLEVYHTSRKSENPEPEPSSSPAIGGSRKRQEPEPKLDGPETVARAAFLLHLKDFPFHTQVQCRTCNGNSVSCSCAFERWRETNQK